MSLLPQTAEYALRALACLVAMPEGARSSDLARRSGVPPAYLQKVLRRLVAAGLLESQKGHGGGFRLTRVPDRIRFLDVLEATEVDIAPAACAFGWSRCDPARPCPLHPAWSELKETFREWAARMTLADAVAPPGRGRVSPPRRRPAGPARAKAAARRPRA